MGLAAFQVQRKSVMTDQGPETIEPIVGSKTWRHSALQAAFLAGAIIATVVFGLLLQQFLERERKTTANARVEAHEVSRQAASLIRSELSQVMPIVQSLDLWRLPATGHLEERRF